MLARAFAVGLVMLAFFAGAYASVATTGNLIPARDKFGGCLAFNTDTGKQVGSWAMVGDACKIRDYRMKHPFGG